MLDDVFTYRLAPDRYLTVTNASNHERDFEWLRSHCGATSTWRSTDVADRYAMLAVQGPVARELVQAMADSPLPARMQAGRAHRAGPRGARLRHGLHGRGRRRAAARSRATRPPSGTSCCAAAPRPCGLAARDTLRLEAGFHLYGNDLSIDRNPIEAGLGWACAEETGFIGSLAVGAARADGPAQKLVGFKIEGSGIARQGNAVVGGGEVTSGTMSPSLGVGIGMAYLPSELAVVGQSVRDRRPRQDAARGRRMPAPSTPRRPMADASYPDDLLYHPDHDWARIEDDVATFGITWFAQDALGEVVFFDPPEVGSSVTAGEFYAEVESVKAVSDVIAPMTGEIVEVNTALAETPEAINDDPYGGGWMVRVKLADPGQADGLMDSATYAGTL